MVYLTGDTHGDIDRFKHGKLRWLGKRDTRIPCCFWTEATKTMIF